MKGWRCTNDDCAIGFRTASEFSTHLHRCLSCSGHLYTRLGYSISIFCCLRKLPAVTPRARKVPLFGTSAHVIPQQAAPKCAWHRNSKAFTMPTTYYAYGVMARGRGRRDICDSGLPGGQALRAPPSHAYVHRQLEPPASWRG